MVCVCVFERECEGEGERGGEGRGGEGEGEVGREGHSDAFQDAQTSCPAQFSWTSSSLRSDLPHVVSFS